MSTRGINCTIKHDDARRSETVQSQRLVLLFVIRLNTCPFQGSRTIRTEEAVMISLAQLSSPLARSARVKEIKQEESTNIEFSDGSPSEESSGSDDSDDDMENQDKDDQ